MGAPIDEAGSGGFRVTGRGRMGDSLATDKDRGQAEAVLVGVEGVEYDMD